MLMPLQSLDKRKKKRDKAIGADTVGGVPDQEQRVLDFWLRLGVGVDAEVSVVPLLHD